MLDLVVSGRFALPGGRSRRARSASRTGASPRSRRPAELTAHERIDVPARAADPARARRRPRAHGQRAGRGRRARDRVGRRRAASRRSSTCPTTIPSPSTRSRASSRRSRTSRREALVDVALYATVAPSGGLDEIAPLHAAGAAAFKVSTFETHPVRFPRVPDGELLLAMRDLRRARRARLLPPRERRHRAAPVARARGGGPHRSDGARRRPPAGGRERGDRPRARVRRSRPDAARTSATSRSSAASRSSGARSATASTPRAETCTHYLVLDEDDLRRLGGRAKINPPLRPRAQQDALWRLLDAGRVDQVTSDHVGWARELKDTPDIFAARSGVPGLETTLPLLFSEGVVRARAAAGDAPARALRRAGGALRPGAAQGRDRAGRGCRPRDLRSGRALAHRRARARLPCRLEPVPWARRDRACQAGTRARQHRLRRRRGAARGPARGASVRPVREQEAG